MTDVQKAIVEINHRLKEFCKELHTVYECTDLFCELHKKYGFEFEINPFKDYNIVGSNFPYINGHEVQWIRFHYSIFKENGLVRYEMELR